MLTVLYQLNLQSRPRFINYCQITSYSYTKHLLRLSWLCPFVHRNSSYLMIFYTGINLSISPYRLSLRKWFGLMIFFSTYLLIFFLNKDCQAGRHAQLANNCLSRVSGKPSITCSGCCIHNDIWNEVVQISSQCTISYPINYYHIASILISLTTRFCI